jgi:hypothetical protein
VTWRSPDTTWEWDAIGEGITFSKDGFIRHPGWEKRGLATYVLALFAPYPHLNPLYTPCIPPVFPF